MAPNSIPGKFILIMLVMVIGAVINLTACAGSAVDQQPISVAVWDLEDLSASDNGQAGMGEMLAGPIAARFGDTNHYQLVDRQHLLKAMEELNLGSSDLADEQTRLKLGRIIGAQQMVFGAFQTVGGMLRLDLRRVDVSSGKILKTATSTTAVGDVSGWLKAADQAAAELVN